MRALSICRTTLVFSLCFFSLQQSRGQINNWTNLFSSHWEDPFWSAGSLPNAAQSVFVTNIGYKAVGVFASTVAGFPGSLTVSNLQLSAPDNALTTLLLNYVGTSVPLRVLRGCAVGTNATLLNLYSAFEVDGISNGLFQVQGGSYAQEGGVLIATNATTLVSSGTINLTNAAAAFRQVNLGQHGAGTGTMTQAGGVVSGTIDLSGGSYVMLGGMLSGSANVGQGGIGVFDQYGGTNTCDLGVAVTDFSPGTGYYHLYGGSISNNRISVATDRAAYAIFDMLGGNITTGSLGIGGLGDSSGEFRLTNGVVISGSLGLGNGNFDQYGGEVTIGSPLSVSGNLDDYPGLFNWFASYNLSNGRLNVPGLNIGLVGSFTQNGGSNIIAGDLSINRSSYALGGGFLMAANITITAGILVLSDGTFQIGGSVIQTGGTNIVTNTLSIFDTYSLAGGTLSVTNLSVNGALSIGSNTATIINAGTCSLAGRIDLSANSLVALGQLTLSSNSLLNLGAGTSSLSFRASSNAAWNSVSLLTVMNWHGSASGGSTCRLFIGTSPNSVAPAQLAHIQFTNPAGFPAGKYAARILSSGEIVPTDVSVLGISQARPQLVLTWPGGLILQTATNVTGPYVDLNTSAGWYTNTFAQSPRQFFRLRH